MPNSPLSTGVEYDPGPAWALRPASQAVFSWSPCEPGRTLAQPSEGKCKPS